MTISDTKITAEWDLMEHAELDTPAEKTKCRKETVASLEIAIRAQGANVAKVKHLLKKDSRNEVNYKCEAVFFTFRIMQAKYSNDELKTGNIKRYATTDTN